MTRPHRLRLWAVAALLALAAPLQARTITLTAEDCDMMAVLSAKTPRLSWAPTLVATGAYNAHQQMQVFPGMSVLLRFPLDAIPKGQRIVKAELSIAPDYVAGTPDATVRRILAEWGTGVCYKYRMTYPDKVEWAQPGGLGSATDRAAKDTAVFHIKAVGEHTVDVTEDVELWYTKAAANRGWILAIENQGGPFYIPCPHSPHYNGGKTWKLRITFEPR